MLRVTCDACGRELQADDEHFVVKVEVYPAGGPAGLTEADLDEDHMEAVAEVLREQEDRGEIGEEPATRHFRYDLCAGCRTRYLRDPLGKESAMKFHFSKN